ESACVRPTGFVLAEVVPLALSAPFLDGACVAKSESGAEGSVIPPHRICQGHCAVDAQGRSRHRTAPNLLAFRLAQLPELGPNGDQLVPEIYEVPRLSLLTRFVDRISRPKPFDRLRQGVEGAQLVTVGRHRVSLDLDVVDT